MPRRRAKARPARRTSQRTPRFFESLGTRRGRRSSAPRCKHRRCNLQPATATGPRRARWPAGSSTRPAARYQTRRGRARVGAVRQFGYRTILPGVISLIAYAGCPVARECLIVRDESHFVGVVSTRGPLDYNISPQTTCVFVRHLCYARTPRKTNISCSCTKQSNLKHEISI